MTWSIGYHGSAVEQFVLSIPDGLLARCLRIVDAMIEYGPHLGMPHTRPMSDGLFDVRLKSKELIARVFYFTSTALDIDLLRGFVKKKEKTPPRELRTAVERQREHRSR